MAGSEYLMELVETRAVAEPSDLGDPVSHGRRSETAREAWHWADGSEIVGKAAVPVLGDRPGRRFTKDYGIRLERLDRPPHPVAELENALIVLKRGVEPVLAHGFHRPVHLPRIRIEKDAVRPVYADQPLG